MDVASALIRLGIPRPPAPLADDVDRAWAWLPLHDPDGKPLTWTRADVLRLLFVRWLYRSGVVNEA